MILLLTEWLKGLLSISWNQKDAKEKQIVMGLSSIKFMEINYGKNCTKRKRVRGLSIRASVKKKKRCICWWWQINVRKMDLEIIQMHNRYRTTIFSNFNFDSSTRNIEIVNSTNILQYFSFWPQKFDNKDINFGLY